MKQQVARLSPHQNAKVIGVLTAIGSLVFIIPAFLIFSMTGGASGGPPASMFLLLPLMYLIFGYLAVAVGCLLYNFMFKYLGGIEYEAQAENAN
jgi:hypothetical protein